VLTLLPDFPKAGAKAVAVVYYIVPLEKGTIDI